VALMRRLYVEKFQHEPRIQACHAGLECGILGAALPGCDMVSFGPTIRGAHSPDECASVSSVAKFYAFFLDVLAHIPAA
jgi:dipeptidase D